MCEIDNTVVSTVTPTQVSQTEIPDFKSLLANLNPVRAARISNERIESLERRLEQLSNIVMNRQPTESVNVTAIETEMREVKEKQASMAEAIDDIKKLVFALYQNIHREE